MSTYPRDEWLHDIEFPDGMADTEDSPPVHVVTKPVLVNGRKIVLPTDPPDPDALVGHGITLDTIVVESQPHADATRVSFEVYADDVEWTPGHAIVGHTEPEDGSRPAAIMGEVQIPHRLFGLRVMSPAGVLWVVSDPGYHFHVAEHGKDDPGPTVLNGEPVTVRVVLFVRSVAFSQRP